MSPLIVVTVVVSTLTAINACHVTYGVCDNEQEKTEDRILKILEAWLPLCLIFNGYCTR